MSEKLLIPFITGLLLMALGSSAKAIIDVNVLKAENETIKVLLQEVRSDVKEIYKHVIKE